MIKLFMNGDDVAQSLFNQGTVLSIATLGQQVVLQQMAQNPMQFGLSQALPLAAPVAAAMHSHVQTAVPTQIHAPVLAPVSMQTRAMIQACAPVQSPAPTLRTEDAAVPTFKTVTLEPGSEHLVYVSYVSDGPLLFSIQLQKMQDTLARLMNTLNTMDLNPLDVDPIPGTVRAHNFPFFYFVFILFVSRFVLLVASRIL